MQAVRRATAGGAFDTDVVHFVALRDIEPRCEIIVDYTDGGTNKLWFPL
jgi:hypothetical protein